MQRITTETRFVYSYARRFERAKAIAAQERHLISRAIALEVWFVNCAEIDISRETREAIAKRVNWWKVDGLLKRDCLTSKSPHA